MPVTSVSKDLDVVTLVIVADFDVPIRRLWDAYADPRQLERFWGPTTYPARFDRHDFAVGGRSQYTMTGPDGDTSNGYWKFLAVDAPNHFEVLDGFALPDGTPNLEEPTMRMVFAFTATDGGSRVSVVTHFNTADEFERLLEMGMDEGTLSAMSQIDAVVGDQRTFAADRPATSDVLDATTVRIARVIPGSVDQAWAAYFDADLVPRWMLGPDGWSMPDCTITAEVGGTYEQVWQSDSGDASYTSTGTFLDVAAPHHARFTARLVGDGIPADAAETIHELTFTPVEAGTLVARVYRYPDTATRDAMIAAGIAEGMEASFQRLEATDLLG
jgi:uncharacterized protein YndB with AHSA1/START domain